MTLKEDNDAAKSQAPETPPSTSKMDGGQSFLRSARSGNIQKIIDFLDNSGDIHTANANGLNALHISSKEGLLEIVQLLVNRNADVNATTKKGNSALHIACLAGKVDVANFLIEHGAKVNVQSQNGFTPLYMAAQENHVEVVKLLLLNSASQTLATDDGFTPLAVALQQGHEKVVAILLENDSRGRIRLPALHIAAKKDDVKAANLLLTNEADVDHQSASGFTPLHIAAHYGNVNIANLLIERGGDVNFQAKNNITPLHVASKWGNMSVAERLVEKGAQLECKTRDGLTPLHCAVRSGHESVVSFLLKSGSNHAAKTRNGLTSLHMASQGDHVECGILLIQYASNINETTMDYLTPLHVASHCGHVRMAKLLIDRACEINARALNGFTPLHIACKKNRIKVVELLVKCGAAIEATTESGLSALHVAAFMGHTNIATILIQNGANPNLQTIRCETSLHLATRANQEEMLKLLLKHGAVVDARAKEQQTPLHIAARLGNVELIKILLQSGANPNNLTKDNYSTLHIAAKEDHVEAARVLIEAGAKLELTTRKGFTALHIAAKYGKVSLATLLLQLGTDPNVQGRNGLTPLHLAVHYSSLPMTMLLLEFQASPFKTSKNGYTPLHISARKNLLEITEKLIENNADSNSESRNGFTPLHLCSQEGHDEMATLLIKYGANANAKAKNHLTSMHLAAQEDHVNVAEILVAATCDIDAKTKAGYTPLHTACHFGKINMVLFLLNHRCNINAQTTFGSTALHLAAQQGESKVITVLLENGTDPNIKNCQNLTAAHVAQRQHYLNIFEVLKKVVIKWEEEEDDMIMKIELDRPELMGENPVTDSEDDYGDPDYTTIPASPLFTRYQNANSVFINNSTTHSKHSTIAKSQSDKASTISGEDSIHEAFANDHNLANKENGFNKESSITAAKTGQDFAAVSPMNDWDFTPDNVPISRKPVTSGFLVSFLVDARGGSMRGSRHVGLRVFVPPGAASAPTRVTCRMIRTDRVIHPPSLNDGEGLACRIIEMGPHPCKFNSPVLLEIPHFASLRGRDREIVILRCDNGDMWKEHSLETTDQAVKEALGSSFGDSFESNEELREKRIVRILTNEFPIHFAIITRLRQEISMIGSDGGVISSSVMPQVQAVFPEGALQKRIKVGLQAHSIEPELVAKLLGNRVAVSPIVTIEPRRRKFHKPITVTIPLPQAANKGMINQGELSNLRLLCSISGGTNPAQWEDITGSTPLSQVKQCVSFTTTVSARFWLMDCPNAPECAEMGGKLYKEAILVPYMGKFVIFAKRTEFEEVLLRCFCITDDKLDKTLECQEGFELKAASPEVEVLDNRDNWLETAGNIIPVTKLGDQLRLFFTAFKENRLPFPARLKDPTLENSVGKIAFMRDSRNYEAYTGIDYGAQSIPQKPLCTLEINLNNSSKSCDHTNHAIESSTSNIKLEVDSKGRPLNEESSPEWNNINAHTDAIARSELDLQEVAQEVGSDWPTLAKELGMTNNFISKTQSEHSTEEEKALTLLLTWSQDNQHLATGNELDRALRRVGREDVVKSCMKNIGRVTEEDEQNKAKSQMSRQGTGEASMDIDSQSQTFSDEYEHQPQGETLPMNTKETLQPLDISDTDIIRESESMTTSELDDHNSLLVKETLNNVPKTQEINADFINQFDELQQSLERPDIEGDEENNQHEIVEPDHNESNHNEPQSDDKEYIEEITPLDYKVQEDDDQEVEDQSHYETDQKVNDEYFTNTGEIVEDQSLEELEDKLHNEESLDPNCKGDDLVISESGDKAHYEDHLDPDYKINDQRLDESDQKIFDENLLESSHKVEDNDSSNVDKTIDKNQQQDDETVDKSQIHNP